MATVAVVPVSTEERLLGTFIERLCRQTGIDLDKATVFADRILTMADAALEDPDGRITIQRWEQADELYAAVIDVIMPHGAAATAGSAHQVLEELVSERTGEETSIVHEVLADGCGMTVTVTTAITERLVA